MPGTVDDFMQRFGGAGTMDESEAAQYHDRFVSNHANDREFDNNTYHEAATQYSASYLMISFVKQLGTPSLRCLNRNVPGC